MTRVFRASHAYDDLPPVPIITARGGTFAPTLATFTGEIQQYTFGVATDNPFVLGSSEVTHTYQEGTDIEAHVHWATGGTNVDDRYVQFQLKVSVAHIGAATGAQQTLLTGDLLIPAATASRTIFVNSFTAMIPGASLVIGDYLVFRFERIAATGTAPTDDPFVLAVGFHVEQDSTGSIARYAK